LHYSASDADNLFKPVFLRVSVILLLIFDPSGADSSGFKFEKMLMQQYFVLV